MLSKIKTRTPIFALILFGFSISYAFATDTKVVVIPMFGDDAAAKWRSQWAEGTDYKKGDIVQNLGSSYIAMSDHTSDNTNDPLATFNAWDLVAASGANGLAGSDGATGPSGAAATVSVGKTVTGLPGTRAAVVNSGTTSAAVFSFTIPKGDKGDTGTDGASPWILNGLDAYYAQGNVGIGTSSPRAELEVSGNVISNAPISDDHLATKAYVDAIGGIGSGGCYVSYSGSCLSGFTSQGSAGSWGECARVSSFGWAISHFRPAGGGCGLGWDQDASIGTAYVCCQ